MLTKLFKKEVEVVEKIVEVEAPPQDRREFYDYGWNLLLAEGFDEPTGLYYKVRHVCIEPGKSMAQQRHKLRKETWTQLSGQTHLILHRGLEERILESPQSCNIQKNAWHKIENTGEVESHVIIIEHGEECSDSDVEIFKAPKSRKKTTSSSLL